MSKVINHNELDLDSRAAASPIATNILLEADQAIYILIRVNMFIHMITHV